MARARVGGNMTVIMVGITAVVTTCLQVMVEILVITIIETETISVITEEVTHLAVSGEWTAMTTGEVVRALEGILVEVVWA